MTTTLGTERVTNVLKSLFAAADHSDGALREKLGKLSSAERSQFLSGAKTDYASFYGKAGSLYLPVSPATGNLLYMMARARRARAVVEYGTSFGISTIHLAAAVRDNGGGHVIGSEFVPEKAAAARKNLAQAGLDDLVEVREGDALVSLARDVPAAIDLVLLDGAKVLYPKILALLEPHLAPGAMIVADNADDSPEYLARVREDAAYLSIAFADDVELTMRLG